MWDKPRVFFALAVLGAIAWVSILLWNVQRHHIWMGH